MGMVPETRQFSSRSPYGWRFQKKSPGYCTQAGQTTRSNRPLSAGEHMTYLFMELVSGMRKFVAAMSTTFVHRVGLYGYRPGARRRAEERRAAVRRKKGVEEGTCRTADWATVSAEVVDGTDFLYRREPRYMR